MRREVPVQREAQTIVFYCRPVFASVPHISHRPETNPAPRLALRQLHVAVSAELNRVPISSSSPRTSAHDRPHRRFPPRPSNSLAHMSSASSPAYAHSMRQVAPKRSFPTEYIFDPTAHRRGVTSSKNNMSAYHKEMFLMHSKTPALTFSLAYIRAQTASSMHHGNRSLLRRENGNYPP